MVPIVPSCCWRMVMKFTHQMARIAVQYGALRLSMNRLEQLGWEACIPLDEDLEYVYHWFLKNRDLAGG